MSLTQDQFQFLFDQTAGEDLSLGHLEQGFQVQAIG